MAQASRFPIWTAVIVAGMTMAGLAGCRDRQVQSMMQPSSEPAQQIIALWWIMFSLLLVASVIVFWLIAVALVRKRRPMSEPPLGSTRFILIGGVGAPAVVLVILQVLSIKTTTSLRTPQAELTIQVIGHQWWWEVIYPEHGIRTANELHIPAGQPVRLEVSTADVIHSFWVPQLNGKIDMIPEQVNQFWLQAQWPGVYRGQCAEFCGLQHALMAFIVVAHLPADFEQWISDRLNPPPPPELPHLIRGQQVFFEAGCHACHAIAGTDARARIGPDLTHIGSRLTLGAATLENNHGNLLGWTANSQAIKPGNLMPPSYIGSADLHALAAYMRSLQ